MQSLSTFTKRLSDLQAAVASSNVYAQIAVTEFNVTSANEAANSIADESCNSFLAGQFLAESFAVGMSHRTYWATIFGMMQWSAHESGGNQSTGDLGMFDDDYPIQKKRSTYQHLRMMAREFSVGRVEVCTTLTTQITLNNTTYYNSNNFKAFARRSCNGAAIMLMNQNQSGNPLTYRFNFDENNPTSTEDIKEKIDMEWHGKFLTSGDPNSFGAIGPQETQLYVLNSCGQITARYKYNITINSAHGDPVYADQLASACACDDNPEQPDWYENYPNPYRVRALQLTAGTETLTVENLSFVTADPNPASDRIHFKGHIEAKEGKICLYTISGVLIKKLTIENPDFDMAFDLSELSNGLYLYGLVTQGNTYPLKKLVVTK